MKNETASQGYIDYTLTLEVVKLILRDEYLKNLVLRYVVDTYREDLRKLLGMGFASIKLEWSEDFENFLSERKKSRKVRDPETVSYYRSLFKKHLEGRKLSEELVEYVANHKTDGLGTCSDTTYSTYTIREESPQKPSAG